MKKKGMLAGAVGISLAIAFTAFDNMNVNAYASEILNSHGNIIMENAGTDTVALYSSDIDRLQEEMDGLFAELPGNGENGFDKDTADADYPEPDVRRRDHINSQGIIDYENSTIVINSADFTYLADEIDDLELSYKWNTYRALDEIGTYFKTDGSYTHDREEGTLTAKDSGNLFFDNLFEGILNSQSVKHLEGQQAKDDEGNLLYYISDEAAENKNLTEITKESGNLPVYIRPVTVRNLTAGTAAWVNGNLIIGNGADNKVFYDNGYRQGYVDGFAQSVSSAEIEYIYHQHEGDSENGGGCYGNRVTDYEICSHSFRTGAITDASSAPGAGMWNYTVRCTHNAGTICGQPYTHTFAVVGDGAYGQGGAQTHCMHYGMNIYKHNVDTGNYHYEIDCGMTEETIVGATIVFP